MGAGVGVGLRVRAGVGVGVGWRDCNRRSRRRVRHVRAVLPGQDGVVTEVLGDCCCCCCCLSPSHGAARQRVQLLVGCLHGSVAPTDATNPCDRLQCTVCLAHWLCVPPLHACPCLLTHISLVLQRILQRALGDLCEGDALHRPPLGQRTPPLHHTQGAPAHTACNRHMW